MFPWLRGEIAMLYFISVAPTYTTVIATISSNIGGMILKRMAIVCMWGIIKKKSAFWWLPILFGVSEQADYNTEVLNHPHSIFQIEIKDDVFKNKWVNIILLSDAPFEKPVQPATSKWNSNL